MYEYNPQGGWYPYSPPQPPVQYSAKRAVLIGHLTVTLPTFLLLVGIFLGGTLLLGRGFAVDFSVLAVLSAWIWYSRATPRWLRWAIARGVPLPDLVYEARRTKLLGKQNPVPNYNYVPNPYYGENRWLGTTYVSGPWSVRARWGLAPLLWGFIPIYLIVSSLLGVSTLAHKTDARTEAQKLRKQGQSYAQDGDYDRAIVAYNQAIKLDPNCWCYYNDRGLARYHNGDDDLAVDDFNYSLKLGPNNGVVYNNRSLAYMDEGEYDKAIADLSKSLELDGDDPVVYYNRASAYMEKENYDQAIADFTSSLKTDDNYADSYFGRGLAYFSANKYSQAINDLSRYIVLEPDDGDAYVLRGDAYRVQLEISKARADYQKAIAIDSESSAADEARSRLKELEPR